jgi:DNA-binding MarR family transcriptional regulator
MGSGKVLADAIDTAQVPAPAAKRQGQRPKAAPERRRPQIAKPLSASCVDDISRFITCIYSLEAEFLTANRALADKYSISQRGIYIMSLIRAGYPRPYQLIEKTGVLPSTITFELNKLEAAKLIRRHKRPGDRRAVELSVTASGLRVVEKAEAITRELLSERVDRFAPPEFKAFLDSFEILARR